MVPLGYHVRRYILGDARTAADHNMRTDGAELMHRGQPADNGEIVNRDVPAKRGVIGKNAAIADHAVMGDVSIHHQQIIIADTGDFSALSGAAVNGHTLANTVAMADFNPGRFTSILQVLIHFADSGELIDLIIFTDSGDTINHNMGFQYRTGTDFHLRANKAKRANMHSGMDNSARFNDGTGMDKGGLINHVFRTPVDGRTSLTLHRRFHHQLWPPLGNAQRRAVL